MIRFPWETEVDVADRRHSHQRDRVTAQDFDLDVVYEAPGWLVAVSRWLPRGGCFSRRSDEELRHAWFQWSLYATAWQVGGWWWPFGLVAHFRGMNLLTYYSQRLAVLRSRGVITGALWSIGYGKWHRKSAIRATTDIAW